MLDNTLLQTKSLEKFQQSELLNVSRRNSRYRFLPNVWSRSRYLDPLLKQFADIPL